MSQAKPIPTFGRNDNWIPNPRDLSTTPGGTLYATTPGGTRIVYDREKLMLLSQSPLSKSPMHLPAIPGVTVPADHKAKSPQHNNAASKQAVPVPASDAHGDDELFTMDGTH